MSSLADDLVRYPPSADGLKAFWLDQSYDDLYSLRSLWNKPENNRAIDIQNHFWWNNTNRKVSLFYFVVYSFNIILIKPFMPAFRIIATTRFKLLQETNHAIWTKRFS